MEKSNFSIILLLVIAMAYSQEFIWENAEDFMNFIFDPEKEEVNSNDYIHRIRMAPNGDDESWQQKINWSNRIIKMGLRIDKPALTDSVQNRKGFISAIYNNYQIIIGNTQIQMGNSLVFGSDYNTIKSSENLTAPGKFNWQVSPYLGSHSSSNPLGAYLLRRTENTKFHLGVENSSLSYSVWKSWDQLSIITAGNLAREDSPVSSLSFLFKTRQINISAETAIKSKITSQYIQLFSSQFNFKWLGQIRFLHPAWKNVYGEPFSGFGDGKNEIGVMISVRKKINKLMVFAWADLYEEVKDDNTIIPQSGQDFLSGIRFTQKYLGIIEFKIRKKSILSILQNEIVSAFQNEEKIYYTVTAKNKLVLKWKLILLSPQNEHGQLFQIQSLKLIKRKWSAVIGAVYFDTNSWDSRLYLIEPGLKGEFRIKPYYERGASFYSRVIWKINGTNSLSFRQSLNMKFTEIILIKPESALQLDIVF